MENVIGPTLTLFQGHMTHPKSAPASVFFVLAYLLLEALIVFAKVAYFLLVAAAAACRLAMWLFRRPFVALDARRESIRAEAEAKRIRAKREVAREERRLRNRARSVRRKRRKKQQKKRQKKARQKLRKLEKEGLVIHAGNRYGRL